MQANTQGMRKQCRAHATNWCVQCEEHGKPSPTEYAGRGYLKESDWTAQQTVLQASAFACCITRWPLTGYPSMLYNRARPLTGCSSMLYSRRQRITTRGLRQLITPNPTYYPGANLGFCFVLSFGLE
jgi:hypothetical protein